MNRSIIFRIVLFLVLVGAMIGLGVFAYNAGLAQGLAQNVQVDASKAPTAPFPYFGYPFRPHFFGFGGFGFMGCLVPLFLIFLAFSALRGLLWFGPRRWHFRHHGPWGSPMEGTQEGDKSVPNMFTEWHRRSHEKPSTETTEK